MFSSLTSFLTDFNLVLVGLVAAFGAGVVFSTKVKDFIKGVPSQARATFNAVEADTISKIKIAQADVLSKVSPIAVAAKAPLAPAVAAPVAPAAPAASITAAEIAAAPVAAPAAQTA